LGSDESRSRTKGSAEITLELGEDLGVGHGGVAVTVHGSSRAASRAVADDIAGWIRRRDEEGRRVVLGLATGSTPKQVYAELVRLHREEGLSFRNAVVFNLDEYWPMQAGARQSFHRYLGEHLLDHVDVPREQTHLVRGDVPLERIPDWCRAYEERIRDAGGIDLQLLGVGRSGHVAFNEPGSGRRTRTRLITLDRSTRLDAASEFFGEWNVPRSAITMGVGTLLEARRIVLLAFGEHKAEVVRRALEEPTSEELAASFLREHPNAAFVLDRAAASALTRFRAPWRLGSLARVGLEWDAELTKRAVVALSGQVGKPILKLTDEDYKDHDLGELLAARGRAYDINIAVFKALQSTITGWPGGKPDRPRADGTPDVFPKRVIVLSPHPDDDVLSMGGTLIRLCDQGHEVHVAYQTSGSIAVWDDDAVRHADFVAELARELGLEGADRVQRILDEVLDFVASKEPGQVDIETVRRIKALVRRTEARAAARYSGVAASRIHFLDLPFYETGRIAKEPLGERDLAVIRELLERVRPHQVYAAGDLTDPHGTHRVCLEAVLSALGALRDEPWMRTCEVWLYRGAWQEWEPHQIQMAVPLSPDEVMRKRLAVFKHESQKDRALFPGADRREFWQRAEDRNRTTARRFDELGLPEYQAIEGFVRWRGPGG